MELGPTPRWFRKRDNYNKCKCTKLASPWGRRNGWFFVRKVVNRNQQNDQRTITIIDSALVPINIIEPTIVCLFSTLQIQVEISEIISYVLKVLPLCVQQLQLIKHNLRLNGLHGNILFSQYLISTWHHCHFQIPDIIITYKRCGFYKSITVQLKMKK